MYIDQVMLELPGASWPDQLVRHGWSRILIYIPVYIIIIVLFVLFLLVMCIWLDLPALGTWDSTLKSRIVDF
jgi:hypothetical protein